MIEIEVRNKKYTLPENWNEVKIQKYLDWYTLYKSIEKVDQNYTVKLLSIFMDISTDEVEDLYIDEINQISSELKWIYEAVPKSKIKKVISIINESNEVVKYCVDDDFTRMKAAETITIENVLKGSEDPALLVADLLAILYRPAIEYKNMETGKIEYKRQPLGDDYSIIKERAEIFKKALYLGEVYPVVIFFSSTVKNSSTKHTGTISSLKVTRGKKVSS